MENKSTSHFLAAVHILSSSAMFSLNGIEEFEQQFKGQASTQQKPGSSGWDKLFSQIHSQHLAYDIKIVPSFIPEGKFLLQLTWCSSSYVIFVC